MSLRQLIISQKEESLFVLSQGDYSHTFSAQCLRSEATGLLGMIQYYDGFNNISWYDATHFCFNAAVAVSIDQLPWFIYVIMLSWYQHVLVTVITDCLLRCNWFERGRQVEVI